MTFSVTGFLLSATFACATALCAATLENKTDAAKPEVLAPGYYALAFEPPAVGSYSLPVIGTAGDGRILDMQGRATTLHQLLGEKYVLLSFIYTQCQDVNGCPLATFVTARVQNRLKEEKALQGKVRFVSISFDPLQDTPAVMQSYGSGFADPDFDWQFVTTASEAELSPILQQYQQSILKEENEQGQQTGVISHILRVFLIDTQKQIRNIYSTSFLHPDTIVNDIKTLLMENRSLAEDRAGVSAHKAAKPSLHGAGDDKYGYESGDYATRALSLENRAGQQADLMKYSNRPPLGLPPLKLTGQDRLTPAKIELGRQLFFDRRLSHNDTFSCAMCHIPEQGFTSNELATAVGIEGRTVRRNSPTLYNVAYAETLFHDARENQLEQQIWSPLLAENEMGNPAVGLVVDKIRAIPEYLRQFQRVFRQPPDIKNIGQAIASYERALVSGNSPFDRWFYGEEKEAISQRAQAGFALFSGKAACSSCHTIGKQFALFTDHQVHNTGIGYRSSMHREPERRRVLVAPGTWLEVDTRAIAMSAEPRPNDLGFYEISEQPQDRWKYKTPGLRNVALTAPYMHDGSLLTLRAVVDFYNAGGIANELLDPRIRPLGLDQDEVAQLVAFLQSLTGDNVDELISDAFAAPVGNVE